MALTAKVSFLGWGVGGGGGDSGALSWGVAEVVAGGGFSWWQRWHALVDGGDGGSWWQRLSQAPSWTLTLLSLVAMAPICDLDMAG